MFCYLGAHQNHEGILGRLQCFAANIFRRVLADQAAHLLFCVKQLQAATIQQSPVLLRPAASCTQAVLLQLLVQWPGRGGSACLGQQLNSVLISRPIYYQLYAVVRSVRCHKSVGCMGHCCRAPDGEMRPSQCSSTKRCAESRERQIVTCEAWISRQSTRNIT